MRRYVIIIGAMKSGTTTLFDILAGHSKIAPCIGKEPGFFAFDQFWDQGFEWFDTLFDFDPERHVYRLEASTDYTKTPFVTDVWDRMTANPDVEVKLIYIMRHPLRRIESHAHHTQRKKKEIGQEISPRADHSLDAGISPISLMISAYATQLDAYRSAWEKGQLHCLTLEELRADPSAALSDIWNFLELDAPPSGPADIMPKNAAADKVRLPPIWEVLTGFGPALTATKTLLPTSVREAVKLRFARQVAAEGRFTLTDAEAAALAALYKSDMARLHETYGIDTAGLWQL